MVKRSKEGGSSMSNENGVKEREGEERMTEHFTWLSIKHGVRDDDVGKEKLERTVSQGKLSDMMEERKEFE